jgi:hypothetical protein
MGMVKIVQNPPTMERVNQRQHKNMADPIIDPALLGKGAMAAVMGNHKKTCQCRTRYNPSEG